MSGKNIIIFLNKTGSRHYRLNPQIDYLIEKGYKIIAREWDNKIDINEMKWADLVILEMISAPKLIKKIQGYNCKVLIDYDDLVESVPKLHPNYEFLKGKRGRKKWREVKKSCKIADGIIVASPELKKRYGRYAKKCLLFPNYLDEKHWKKTYCPNDSDQIRLLWAGSTSHKADLIPFKPVLKDILEKNKNVKFIYIGTGGASSSNPITELFYGEDFFKGFPDNREYIIGTPSGAWSYKLASLRADIGLAPLEKNYFNKCKSFCKYLEYSINKIPAVYSGWFYKDIVKHNETGLLANTPEEWKKAIKSLIDNPDLRKRLAENAYQDVIKNYNIKDHLQTWENFINLIKDKGHLLVF